MLIIRLLDSDKRRERTFDFGTWYRISLDIEYQKDQEGLKKAERYTTSASMLLSKLLDSSMEALDKTITFSVPEVMLTIDEAQKLNVLLKCHFFLFIRLFRRFIVILHLTMKARWN